MEISRSNVFEIINRSSLNPDKDYGQNFLLEPKICNDIVSYLDINKDDSVLEIGPGLGSLTHFLSSCSNSIDVIDIDERMTNFLKVIYQENSNVHIICSDIRKVDVSKYNKIIGNLPYNITSELIIYLLINAKNVKKIVLMSQLEAYERISATSGKDYGPLSILIHLLGDIKKLLVVKPGSFYPQPKCNSLVFSFTSLDGVDKNEVIEIYKLSKSLFLNRRKTILNNLTNLIKDKDRAKKILNDCQIMENKRPEEIIIQDYVKLYSIMKKLENNL